MPEVLRHHQLEICSLGSTPAASTTFPKEIEQIRLAFPAASTISPRPRQSGPVSKQPNGCIERRRTQVHVALRRRQVLMSGQLLNRPRWGSTHRQVRTERVPQDVNARLNFRAAAASVARHLHHLLGERLSRPRRRAHACREMPRSHEAPRPTEASGHVRSRPPFGAVRALSTRTGHRQLPLRQVESVHSSAMISPHRRPASPPSRTTRYAAHRLALGRFDQALVRLEVVETPRPVFGASAA